MKQAPKATGTRGQLRPAGPGRGKKTSGTATDPPVSNTPTLADQGVDKKTANLARQLAALSDAERNTVAAGDKTLAAVIKRRLSPPLPALTARPSAVSGGAQGRKSEETPMKQGCQDDVGPINGRLR